MSPAEISEDKLYQACITWNLPVLRRSDREDVQRYIRTIQLLPSALRSEDLPPARMSPLRRAAEGLRLELEGDGESARAHYDIVAKKADLPGVLGCLLLAWMSDATERDFDRAERKLSSLGGRGAKDVLARGHCKLALWAFDHGWTRRSQHHFNEARRSAGNALAQRLDEVGHWFESDRVILFKPVRSEMTSFPWIVDWVDQAAQRAVEEQFRESFKSPWTRTWSFGASMVEGLDIQSAEMQASWAGALWLLPPIQRQHAALIMAKSQQSNDVARAIALWVKGGGQSSNQLVANKEAFLSEAAIHDLLKNQLHEGRSVHDRKTWLEVCHALWAEMPEDLVRNFVLHYQEPPADLRPHDDEIAELGLFGKLLARSDLAIERASVFNEKQLGMLARGLWPQLLSELPQGFLFSLLTAGLSEPVLQDDDWTGTGWPSLAKAWSLLDPATRADTRDAFLRALPASAVAEVAVVSPDLVPVARMREALDASVKHLDTEVRDAAKGVFHGWGTQPAFSVARLSLALGQADEAAVGALINVVIAPDTGPQQRLSCLDALASLAESDLLSREQVEAAFAPVLVNSVMSDDADLDQRLEDVARLALQVQFGYDRYESEGPLLAASRDRDAQVRRRAVSTVCNLSLKGISSPSLDATLLGALYDPHPRVQTAAIPAIWRGRFDSATLRDVAQARLVESWSSAHREVREMIARESALSEQPNTRMQTLRRSAAEDRSWAVRRSARDQ